MLLCVLWWGTLDRLWLRAAQSVRVCSTTGYITSGLRGPSPQALTLFGGVGFIARRLRPPWKGECRRGPRHFWKLPLVLGFGPATGPTLKTALCHIRTLVGRRINTARLARFFLDDAALCPVVGHSRPTVVASCTVILGVFHHWIHHLWPQGAVPPGFNPLRRGWVYRPAPEAPRKRGMPTGSEAFFGTASRVGLQPCDRTNLKTALCHIRTLVGRRINTARLASAPGPILDFGPERGPGKGTMADLGPFN